MNIAWLLFLSACNDDGIATVMVPLASMYASLKSRKLVFNTEVLNLIWPLVLYVPRASSFISTQLFVLKLDGWFGVLPTNLSFSEISFLHCDVNLISSVIYFLFLYIETCSNFTEARWFCRNTCVWAHVVRLHIADTNELKSAQQVKQGA